jgi:soluble lytic murein transglycosylase-like protein
MKSTVTTSILVGCSLFYNSSPSQPNLSPARLKQSPLPNVTSKIRYIWPEVKRFIDTHAIIHAAATRHHVPAHFVKSLVAAESNFNPYVVSPRGAIGLMQLMPATAQKYGADPNIPEQNVDAGTQYLSALLKRYSKHRDGLRRAIAAYNAGPTIVDRYRGVPPYRETRNYVTRVMNYIRQYQKKRGA